MSSRKTKYADPFGNPLTRSEAIEYMNSRAMAQWSGQPVTLPMVDRKGRIIKAMQEKGFGDLVEEIKWPV